MVLGFRLEQGWDAVGQLARQRGGRAPGLAGMPPGPGVERAYAWSRDFAPRAIRDGRWGETAYETDAAGQITETRFGDGEAERFAYDPAPNLCGLSDATSRVQAAALRLDWWRSGTERSRIRCVWIWEWWRDAATGETEIFRAQKPRFEQVNQPMIPREKTMRNITRTVQHDDPCWAVTLYRDNGARGRRLYMTFTDATFGGEAPALVVAQAWRDAALAVVPPLVRSHAQRTPGDARSTPNVFFKKASNTRRAYWVARFVPPGADNEAVCSFSVDKFGEATARVLAEAECRRMVEALEPDPAWTAPTLPQLPQDPLHPTDDARRRGGPHDEAFYGIHREPWPPSDRWLVAIRRANRDVRVSFSDATFGGPAQALHVARAVRDAAARVVPPMTKVQWRQLPRRRLEPGLTGVHYRPPKDGRAGLWAACIQVEGPDGPHLVTRLFSEATYAARARPLAIAERQRMLDALQNGDDPHLRGAALTLLGGTDAQP